MQGIDSIKYETKQLRKLKCYLWSQILLFRRGRQLTTGFSLRRDVGYWSLLLLSVNIKLV
jgi:hypothetical protein